MPIPTPGFAWTDDRTERLKTMWAEGLSCSQIARQLGGVSRNAVIGKVHRLGLQGRAGLPRKSTMSISAVARPCKISKQCDSGSGAMLRPVSLPPTEPAITGEEPTLTELTSQMCRFPVGEADGWQQRFCGKPKAEGAYCAYHARKSINPQGRKASTGLLKQMGHRTPMVLR